MVLFSYLLIGFAPAARAAKLDLTTDVRVEYVSYDNLNLTSPASGGESFYDHNARLGFALKGIDLADVSSDMDVAIAFTSMGIGASTAPVASPFDRAADRVPTTGLGAFLSTAYVRVRNVLDQGWNVTAGRQPVLVGSGLLLDDDGVGMTGLLLERPWAWNSKFSLYVYQPNPNGRAGIPDTGLPGTAALNIYGASAELPGTDGTWQLHHVWEDDEASPIVLGNMVTDAQRHFTSVRYVTHKNMLTFDGEAAIERGGASGGPFGSVSFTGYAYMMRGTWEQKFGKFGTGSGRLVYARGSGADPTDVHHDAAFFPSFGHRFDGLQRDGFGSYLGATPYDVLPVSSATQSGMLPGVSGVQIAGLGVTAPPWHRVLFDFDFVAFTANQQGPNPSNIGHEIDLALRYQMGDKLALKLAWADFSAGGALSSAASSATRIAAFASGRF